MSALSNGLLGQRHRLQGGRTARVVHLRFGTTQSTHPGGRDAQVESAVRAYRADGRMGTSPHLRCQAAEVRQQT